MTDNEHDEDFNKGPFHLTGRGARRALRRGHRLEKPLRSRIQRKTPKQRAYWPGLKAVKAKQARRAKRIPAWLEAESAWLDANAA